MSQKVTIRRTERTQYKMDSKVIDFMIAAWERSAEQVLYWSKQRKNTDQIDEAKDYWNFDRAVRDAQSAMNYWEERMEQYLVECISS